MITHCFLSQDEVSKAASAILEQQEVISPATVGRKVRGKQSFGSPAPPIEESSPLIDDDVDQDEDNNDINPIAKDAPTSIGDDDGSVDDDPGQIEENQEVRNLDTTTSVNDYITIYLIKKFQAPVTETPSSRRYPQRTRKSSLDITDSGQQPSPSTSTRRRRKASEGKVSSPSSSFLAAKKSMKEQEAGEHHEKRRPVARKKKAGVPKTDKEKHIQALLDDVDNWQELSHRDMSLVAQYQKMKSNKLSSDEAILHRIIFQMFQFFEKKVSLGETMCNSSILQLNFVVLFS